MHSISEVGTNVPAFLAKLWKLVEDPTTNGLITWSSEGSSFLIMNQAQFSRELLPLYYKHNNLASFIRQLNMYGFRKISSVDSGGLKLDKDEMEFAHKYFLRGHPYLLDSIKRKIPTGAVHNSGSMSNSTNSNVKPELVSRVLQDVRQMKGRQETLDSRFNAMKRENEALWRELALLRQKHMKQQQIVNKLIQFLVTLVQPNRGLGIKRTYPLMLNDSSNVLSNSRRGATQPKAAKLNLISDVMTTEELSPKGPVIHELDNNVEYILPDDDYEDLGGVDFDYEKEDTTENSKVGVAAGVSADKFKSGVGYRQCEPVSPEIGAEAGDLPIELAKQRDRVVPLVNSPSSSLGNLGSLPSSPANTMDVTTGNLVDDILVSDPDPQSNDPENCLLPSVEYPLSPEMFMGSVDPAVVSPAPVSKLSTTKGQTGSRISKNSSKSSTAAVKKSFCHTNRRTKQPSTSVNNNSEVEDIDVYPEIHLEEGSAAMNDEEANLLRSLTSSGVNVNDLNLAVEQSVIPEENGENNDSNMALACTSGSSGKRGKTSENIIREELDMHIDTMQSEIDILKEMLMKGNVSSSGLGGSPGNDGDILGAVGGLEGYCLDASALLGVCPASLGHLLDPAVIEGGGHVLNKLFSSDDLLPIGINSLPGSSGGSSGKTKENLDFSVSGNEIAAYNPTLLDLVEDDDDSQILNWCNEESSMSKETSSSGATTVTSNTGGRGKGSVGGSVLGITGKGAGKVNVTSVNSPKNTNPSRRKTK